MTTSAEAFALARAEAFAKDQWGSLASIAWADYQKAGPGVLVVSLLDIEMIRALGAQAIDALYITSPPQSPPGPWSAFVARYDPTLEIVVAVVSEGDFERLKASASLRDHLVLLADAGAATLARYQPAPPECAHSSGELRRKP